MGKIGPPADSPEELEAKRRSFNAAMERFNSHAGYRLFGIFVAVTIVTLQLVLLWRLSAFDISFFGAISALFAAWVLADFLNGLVHMYMDAKEGYDSLVGPLIANFHLHHRTPVYTARPLPVVYFIESGSKVWLAPCLGAMLLYSFYGNPGPWLLYLLVFTGVLSSVAEVSHYLCHTSSSPVAKFLGDCGILLSKRHHAVHHLQDNVSYAFLNGLSDPLLNLLAAKLSPGYKNNTDLHYAAYEAEVTSR